MKSKNNIKLYLLNSDFIQINLACTLTLCIFLIFLSQHFFSYFTYYNIQGQATAMLWLCGYIGPSILYI